MAEQGEGWRKWQTVCRKCFEIHFTEKVGILITSSLFVPEGQFEKNIAIGSDNDLLLNR